MKQEILLMMQKQLHALADKINYDNLNEMDSEIHRVFTILEATSSLIDMGDAPNKKPSKVEEMYRKHFETIAEEIKEDLLDTETEEKKEQPAQEEDNFEETLTPSTSDEEKSYVFERKIKGGFISEIDAFVPEKVIQELALSDGDEIYAEFLFEPEHGPTRYNYSLAKKLDPPRSPKNIVEVNMGIVTYEPRHGGYCITKTVNEDQLMYEGEPLVLKISDNDIDAMSLSEGDVVNAAYYENNPDNPRVRWRHTVGSDQPSYAVPKPSSFYKTKKDDDKDDVSQVFKGKTIAVVGYEPGQPAFKEEIEKRGGTMIGLTGRENDSTLYASLRKSDGLVIVIGHVGHNGTQKAVDFCKSNGIPHTSTKTFGRTTFVDSAESLLK